MKKEIKVIILIIGMIVFVGSLVLNIMGIAEIFGITLPLPILYLAGFLCFIGVMGWTLWEYNSRIKELEDKRPLIYAVCGLDLHTYYIDVRNDGNAGDFQIQIQVMETTEPNLELLWGRYNGYWNEEQEVKIAIPAGITKQVRLATIESARPYTYGYLRMYRMVSNSMNYMDTHSYVINPQSGLVPEALLLITITSVPRAKNGEVTLALQLRADYDIKWNAIKKRRKGKQELPITKEECYKVLEKVSSQ